MIFKKIINLLLIFFNFSFNLFSKNEINITKMRFLNNIFCNPIFLSVKCNSDKFVLFEIKNVKEINNNINVFEIDLKDENNKYFLIEGEDNTKNKYKIDKEIESDKNKKFELRLDLKNEKIEIQEITGYDLLNKKNEYNNNIFIFDFKDFTCVIFKLTKKVKKTVQEKVNGVLKDVEKEVDEDKYIFCNDCNTFEIGDENDKNYYGMFSNTLKDQNFYKVSVEWVSKNKDKWTNIRNMFSKNKFIEEVDFGNFDYKFKDISFCFSECKNLKNVKNLKKLFNDNLNSVEYFFDCCKKIDNIDISNVKLPEDSSCFFSCSSIKNLKYDNLDCSKCKNLDSFFWGTNIEEFDFNKLKNTENIEDLTMFFCDCENLKKVIFNDIKFPKLKKMDQMFDSCKILDEIIGFENVKLKLKGVYLSFFSCNSLKKLNLSNLVITDNYNRIVDFRYIKDLILPNDKNSAKLMINDIKNFFNRTYGKNLDNKFNIYYKNQKLENVSKFDDINKFLDNPEGYVKEENRSILLKNNEQKYLDSLKKIDKDTLKAVGCCSKCCCC